MALKNTNINGIIVSTDQLRSIYADKYSKLGLKKKIYGLKTKGELIPLRRGLYFIPDISGKEPSDISPFAIAAAYNNDSYISLDAALSHYGLFGQKLRTIASITTRKSRKFVFQENAYIYLKIIKKLYFGFKTEDIAGYTVKIAELEKVILDYLYFKNDSYSIDLLLEIAQKVRERIDFRKFFAYAKEFPEATKRKLGFILDLLNMDTAPLHGMVGSKGYSRLTPNSNRFNAKWRLYYEERFITLGKIWTIVI